MTAAWWDRGNPAAGVSAPRAPLRPPWPPVSSLTTQAIQLVRSRGGAASGARGAPADGAQAVHLQAVQGHETRSTEGRRGAPTQGTTCSRLGAPHPSLPLPLRERPEELCANPVHPLPPINAPSLTLRGTPFPTDRGEGQAAGSRQPGASLARTALATWPHPHVSP